MTEDDPQDDWNVAEDEIDHAYRRTAWRMVARLFAVLISEGAVGAVVAVFSILGLLQVHGWLRVAAFAFLVVFILDAGVTARRVALRREVESRVQRMVDWLYRPVFLGLAFVEFRHLWSLPIAAGVTAVVVGIVVAMRLGEDRWLKPVRALADLNEAHVDGREKPTWEI